MTARNTRARGVLALRFDVDSVTCLEKGVPALLRLGDLHGVRFTFFVNMGRSFSWRYTLGRMLRRPRGGATASASAGPSEPHKLSAAVKLGRMGVARTVALNPRLGRRYRSTLDLLHREGHELGLHGGSDHAAWQYGLDELKADGLERLVRMAFTDFRDRYGLPGGSRAPDSGTTTPSWTSSTRKASNTRPTWQASSPSARSLTTESPVVLTTRSPST